MRLILGSGSPRRVEILAVLGLTPDDIRPPDIDEDPLPNELPKPYVDRIVRAKADAVHRDPGDVVLCADTTVALGRRILGKPADADQARAFLTLLGGRRHRVLTGIAVKTDDKLMTRIVESRVKMKRLSKVEMDGYIATGDWQGKAGGYAIHGPAGAFFPWISGSHSAIVGLPMVETANLLQAAGIEVWKT
ncbi:Maf family protein [Rhodobacteraceae bacterium N5(2021)]|uniref:Nucleoside triphosphate pyrophosphatase n=1 Tax=Gymnodinialimonas phycosphaerae TaxID=2841589 RepID=A0A975TZ46_9RHOB|nr:Maf family protein [Gymnodinialimonas phycosphaerae]MBY4892717.1 Maf family protein [Gymnodinialimonas phycosphaerae]